jgi:CubicO group peptidase (beta-lactamase class C family)
MKTLRLMEWISVRLLLITLLVVPAVRPTVNAAEPDKAVVSAVQPFVDANTLAGAVMLVASKDRVLSLEAVGWADVATRLPMRTNALFWIASQSKPMTAAALMILVDQGKVKLGDPVA